jgi:rod shape-determining protein MreD
MSVFWGRSLVAAVWVMGAVLLQTVVLSQLGLPGATPDLIVVLVAGWGLSRGSLEGVIVGFAAGLFLDVMPPAVGTFGIWPLVLALVGFLTGLLADDSQGSSLTPLLVVAVAALSTLALYAGVSQGLYAVLLALVVLPALSATLRWVEPSSPRY